MITPEIKDLQGYPVHDPAQFQPERPDYFGIRIMLWVGAKGEDRSDYFNMWVCSPSWFADNGMHPSIRKGAGKLFTNIWNWNEIYSYIEEYISQCTAETWIQCAFKITLMAEWEYYLDAVAQLPLDMTQLQ